MKTLKVLLQEVVSGIKAWVNSNFAQESNTVHKTGNETVNGNKTFTGNVFQNQAGGVNVYCATCDGAVKGDLTSSGTLSIVCKDGSNANMETSGLAAVYMGQDTSGSYVALRADTSYNNTRYNASVSLDIDPTTANNNAIFRPRRDNTIDLGSSSYQFKNLYANNYYYKGTAWGLDKANEWTNEQTYSAVSYGQLIRLKNTGLDLSVNGNTGLSDTFQNMIHWVDNSNNIYSSVHSWTNNSKNVLVLRSYYRTDANTSRNLSVRFENTATDKVVYPETDADTNLGNSTHKWKTFNGLNPGALSLPAQTGYVTIDTTNWDLTGKVYDPNYYTPTVDGWLCVIALAGTMTDAWLDVWVNSLWGQSVSQTPSGELFCMIPVRANLSVRIRVKASSIYDARLFVASGNV